MGKKSLLRAGLTRVEKIALSALASVFLLALVLFYKEVLDQKQTSDCLSNLKEIANSINLYQLDYESKLPLAYYADGQGQPMLNSRGKPLTWVNPVSSYVKKSIERVFVCPSDPLKGSTKLTHPREPDRLLSLSYGFYTPVSGQVVADLQTPGQIVLIADSLAGGRLGSLNPNPLLEGNDGFILTPDDTLFRPTDRSRYITRLSIWKHDTKLGWTLENMRSFHGRGVNVLMADGHVATRSTTLLNVERDASGKILSPWFVPEPRENGVYSWSSQNKNADEESE